MYWGMFETAKRTFDTASLEGSRQKAATFGLASACAVMSSLVTHPLDIVKTNQQGTTTSDGMVKIFRHIWQQEGLRGLYRGAGLRCAAIIPASGLFMTVYESVKAMVHEAWHVDQLTG